MDITVAIDAMGGDYGPRVTIPAALALLKQDSKINIILVGLSDDIEAELQANLTQECGFITQVNL